MCIFAVNANGGNPVLFPSTTGNQQQLSGMNTNAFMPNIYANFGPNNYGGRYGSPMHETNGEEFSNPLLKSQ